jgi:hypothetical protein
MGTGRQKRKIDPGETHKMAECQGLRAAGWVVVGFYERTAETFLAPGFTPLPPQPVPSTLETGKMLSPTSTWPAQR